MEDVSRDDIHRIDLTVDDDELDIMTASSPTLPVSAMSSPIKPSELEGRTLRSRKSLGSSKVTAAPKSRKRARTLSTSAIENQAERVTAKKLKLNDKKAVTIVINAKRVSAESARKRWLLRHKHLFEPLLPASSVLIENLQADVNASTDKAAYAPLHQLEEQPSLIKGGVMKDYQLQGLSFLAYMYNNGMNCILGDEMGLGKTLQTLSLLAYVRENTKGTQDPHLIICPLSVLPSWLAESARWLPSFKTLRFHGQNTERDRLKTAIRNNSLPFDLCITTYDAYTADESWFKSRRWTYCVLDEGHKIKNAETNLAHKVQGIGALFRLILTGTPVQNNLVELWGLLHWLYPTIFTPTSQRLFKESFDLSRGSYALPFLSASKNLLSTIMLRRTKAVVEASVPPRSELTVFVPLTEAQRFWTYRLLTRMDSLELEQIFTAKLSEGEADEGRTEVLSNLSTQVKQSGKAGGDKWKKLMNLLLQLRFVCDHPYLLPDAEPTPLVNGEHIVAASSKLIVIDKLLADILPKGERVLIFSQWTGMLDLLEDFLALRDIKYARLDGSTNRPRRSLDIKLFQQEKSPYQVFLISTKAGGLGINLTKASTVIMCDSDWNPQNDLQAIARAHRIGQTKTVNVYRLICRGSVEDQMLDRIRRKLFLSLKVMGSDNPTNGDNNKLGASELIDILRKGSSALSRKDEGMDVAHFLDAPIADILDMSRSREDARDAKLKHELDENEGDGEDTERLLKEAEEEERALLSGVAQVQSRLFEGRVVARQTKNNKEIAQEWHELQKRARVDRTVTVDGIAVIAAHIGTEAPVVKISEPRKTKKKFESEDYCIYCRDGGEMVLCTRCPRVFHAKCHGMTKAEVRKSSFVSCSQHACATCSRSTADAGGMLFRCQTCPQAFCEDCVPNDEIDALGDVLPEFLLLGHGPQSTAYFIRCHDCSRHFKEDPSAWKLWEEEIRQTQRKLDALDY